MHLLFTELDRASCSPFQMEKGETKFEMGYNIQLVSVNNTCTTPYAARCVAINAHAKIRVFLMFNVMYNVMYIRRPFYAHDLNIL